uniref:HP domain-containing protein n=1 Tax=Arcella intermedia TaxID=1963864 RepID=A0A6B2KXM5_9EUKA
MREAGKSPGLRIWRIDNKSQELSNVAKNSYGIFKEEDAYIALESKIGESKFTHSLFVWFGKSTSQEKFALSKVADLEKELGGFAKRSEERQEKESQEFKNLFKMTLQYVEPVVLSEQVNLRDEDHPTRLYHLKGKHNVSVSLVELSSKSLITGDVFLLDADIVIFQWNGKGSSRMEKAKALDLTVRLRDERMNRCKSTIVIIDEGKETDDFWKHLGGKGPLGDAKNALSDEAWEERALKENKLYKIVEVGSEFKFELVDTHNQPLHSKFLEASNGYLVDVNTQVLIWTGRTAPQKIKNNALDIAKKFVADNKRPSWTAMLKVVQGVEPALFRAHFRGPFSEYIDTPEAHEARLRQANVKATTAKELINVDALHHPEKYRAAREELSVFVPDAQVSNVTEKELKIWFVKDKQKHPLPEEEYGFFYSGASYVVMYSIRLANGTRKHVVYYWQGRHSAVDDKGASSLLATDLSQNKGRGCTLVRIAQGKEPEHFLTHFAGYMCTRTGKREEWQKENEGKPRLYHVRGTNEMDTTAQQIEAKAFSLNSNDVFVLDSAADTVYVWNGKGANAHEVKMGEMIIGRLVDNDKPKQRKIIPEGSETEDFWKLLGGKGHYSNEPELAVGDIHAKLFHCTDRTGSFKVVEIEDFTQDDLDPDDVYILDAHNSVFVWIGSGSTANERTKGSTLAVEYIKAADDGRVETCPIYVVDAGTEPVQFTLHFHGWDDSKAKKQVDVYSRKLIELNLTEAVVGGHEAFTYSTVARAPTATPVKAAVDASGLNPKNLFFSFERLKAKPLPEGVDGGATEAFLSDEDFTKYFKASKEEFFKYPKWKQLRIKKEVGLF